MDADHGAHHAGGGATDDQAALVHRDRHAQGADDDGRQNQAAEHALDTGAARVMQRHGAYQGAARQADERRTQHPAIDRVPLAIGRHRGQHRPRQQHRAGDEPRIDQRQNRDDEQRQADAQGRLKGAAERHDPDGDQDRRQGQAVEEHGSEVRASGEGAGRYRPGGAGPESVSRMKCVWSYASCGRVCFRGLKPRERLGDQSLSTHVSHTTRLPLISEADLSD